MSSADPWIKLWWSFYTSPSHVGIGEDALAVGPPLMLFAKKSPLPGPDGVRWLLWPDGSPVTVEDIAGVAQKTVRKVKNGLKKLAQRETIVMREDGVIGWPKFSRYQETPEAERKRRERAKKKQDATRDETKDAGRDGHADSHAGRHDKKGRKGERENLKSTGGGNPTAGCAASAAPPPPPRVEPENLPAPSQGEPAPVLVLRNQPPDEQALDDPGVRSTGDVVVRPGEPITIDTLRWARGKFVADLPEDQRLRVPEFNRNAKTVAGIVDAVRTYGEEIVWQVVRWAWGEAAAGRLDDTKLACTFHGSGFGVRLKDWRIAQEHERRRARLGVERAAQAAPAAPESPPMDMGALAELSAAAASRLRGEA